jgi:hypothetical protein
MIFNTFDPTDIVSGRVQQISTGMFSGGVPTWTTFYTSSTQAQLSGSNPFDPLNGLYYLNVYDNPTGSASSEVCFSIAYGHYAGSGSSANDVNTSVGSLLFPTQAIYSQYRNYLLVPGDELFTFYSGPSQAETSSVDLYVINFAGAKVLDQLDPGQFQLTLKGTNGTFNFIDDSNYNSSPAGTAGGQRYNIVQGTIANGATLDGTGNVVYQSLGSMYPDLGIVLLNPTAVSNLIGLSPTSVQSLATPTSSLGTSNNWALMHFRFSETIINNNTGSIQARVTEYVPAIHYFVRVKNQEFNYSNNPSFVFTQAEADAGVITSGQVGTIRFPAFYNDPQVYLTSVGLYNNSNDLVAVAKLSQPANKNFENEVLIKVAINT